MSQYKKLSYDEWWNKQKKGGKNVLALYRTDKKRKEGYKRAERGAREVAYRKYVREHPNLSKNKIISNLKGTDLSFGKKSSLQIIRDVRREHKKPEAWKYTPEKYKTEEEKRALRELKKIKEKKVEEKKVKKRKVKPKKEFEELSYYWSYDIEITLQREDIIGVGRHRRIISHKRKHRFYINSGIRLSREDIAKRIKVAFVNSVEKLKSIDNIKEEKKRYVNFEGRIEELMREA
jgi:hypothetical protein